MRSLKKKRAIFIFLSAIAIASGLSVVRSEIKVREARKEVENLILNLSQDTKDEIQQVRIKVASRLRTRSSFSSLFAIASISGGVLSVAIFIDLRNRNLELENAENRERAIAVVVAGFSHDVRNYLQQIILPVEAIQFHGINDRRLLQIQRGINKISRLVDDVIAFSDEDKELDKEEINLFELTSAIVEDWRVQCNRITLINQNAGWIFADRGWVERAIYNLISNAIKYSAAPNTVVVVVNRFSVLVGDKGIGVSIKRQELLFKPFVRGRNTGGTNGVGLGLTIVKQCVELHHNAKIEVLSKEDGLMLGYHPVRTIFRLTFPTED